MCDVAVLNRIYVRIAAFLILRVRTIFARQKIHFSDHGMLALPLNVLKEGLPGRGRRRQSVVSTFVRTVDNWWSEEVGSIT